jgi:D-alanyl-D-alanine carboxypeptidase
LGLNGSHFVNPHGLDAPEHYATARDLAILASYAMENPIFEQTVSTKNVRVGQRYLKNHNKLLWQVEGADGVKTGYTKAAGRILVSSATREGRRVVMVTINDPNDWQDHAQLIDHAFSDYTIRKVVSAGDVLGTVEVLGGVKKKVKLVAVEHFSYAMRPDETCEFLIPGSGFVYAPVAKNGSAGFVYVTIGGKAVGKVEVAYAVTIEQEEMPRKSFLKRLFGG